MYKNMVNVEVLFLHYKL